MATTSTQLQLFFRAEGLKDADVLSKSDPYLVLYAAAAGPGGGRQQLGRTETVKDCLCPTWTTAVPVTYFFEQKQELVAELFDDDGPRSAPDPLGTVGFQLAHVVGSRGSTLRAAVRTKGTLSVTAKELGGSARDTWRLQFRGHALKKMDLIGKSDPYYILRRRLPNGGLADVFRSKCIDNTLEPSWDRQPAIPLSLLSGGSVDERCLRFCCFDRNAVMADKPMGFFDASPRELLEAPDKRALFKLKNEKGKCYGDVEVVGCETKRFPTFVELLGGGLQMNLAVAIDFTASNGNPSQRGSLHYMDPSAPNQYVRAIMSVGDILMEYDTDKRVPVYGFGAGLPGPNRSANHCFNVTLQPDPHVVGVQGILDAYGRSLPQLNLLGPTNFAPIVRATGHAARQQPGVYTVLLILTDGAITDMDATIGAIVENDDAPFSIIIVGVGSDCDFRLMDALDADGTRLSANGRTMKRDIVQFVPFRQFLNAPPGGLAAEVLREVPAQVEEWAVNTGYAAPSVAQSAAQTAGRV